MINGHSIHSDSQCNYLSFIRLYLNLNRFDEDYYDDQRQGKA